MEKGDQEYCLFPLLYFHNYKPIDTTSVEIPEWEDEDNNPSLISVLFPSLYGAFHHCEFMCYIYSWNAGMGNTDTLHPNSCFCYFSIPTSKEKIFCC